MNNCKCMNGVKNMNNNIACFDIGGTFMKYAVVSEQGNIIFNNKVSTPKQNCREEVPRLITSVLNEIRKEYDISKVGISTTGHVDFVKGEIIYASNNMPAYTGAKLSEYIQNETGLVALVENDVNAAALGEMWKGAAKKESTFVCLTIGTGIGGAIVVEGKLFRGRGGVAGEFGHMKIRKEGEKCNCGRYGCFERYASTSALIRNYTRVAAENGLNVSEINGERIIDLVLKNDAIATSVYEEFIDSLVTGIVNIVQILDPGYIVIGGGISAQGEKFFKDINEKFKKKSLQHYLNYTQIVQAKLQNNAAIYGMAYLALN